MSRILVAEDDPHILRVICLWLTRQGHEVLEARNGLSAWEVVQQSQPEILITDINMPGMSGLELLGQIKQNYKTPPPVVMMITAYGDDENYNTAKDLGADDFLTKPVEFNLLKEKLKEIA